MSFTPQKRSYSCSRWWLAKRFTAGQCTDTGRLWDTQPSVKCLHETSALEVQDICRRGDRSIARASGSRWTPRKWCLPGHAGLMHKRTHRVSDSMHETRIGSNQTKSLQWKEGKQSHTYPRIYLQLAYGRKWRSSFANGTSLSIPTILCHWSHAVTKSKRTPWFLCPLCFVFGLIAF